jgi:hypothetical protein
MTKVAKKNSATGPLVTGMLFFLCALTFYYFSVLRIDYNKTALLDLHPGPDAAEYFAQAKALLKGERPSIQIGYDKLPSRYPPGYPALMLPWLKILPGADAVLAPFRTNQTLGVLLLLAVFAFYTYLAMPLTGGFAALLLATLPGFFTFCRSSLSEIGASLLIVFAFMFSYLGLNPGRRWAIYLSAVFLGLSLNVRLQSVFFAPLLLAIAVFPANETALRRISHFVGIMIVFCLAASPMLLMNTIQFSSPFKTGYDFWIPPLPPWWGQPPAFSLRYVPMNLALLWSEFSLRYAGYSAANIFGTGTYVVPAFVLLICVAAVFVQMDRFALCALLSGLSFLTVTLCYALPDARFYLPLFILLVAVAVLPVTWAAKNLFAGRWIITSLAVFGLFAGACLGYPSRSGYNTRGIDRCQAWDALNFCNPPRLSTQYLAQRHFAKLLARQPGIVLADIDPVYLNALLPNSFVAAPIDGNHHYKWSLIWRYERREALALVERGLEQSLPVYALFTSPDEVAMKQPRLPSVPGYQWRILNNSHGKAVILKLDRVGSDETAPPSGSSGSSPLLSSCF